MRERHLAEIWPAASKSNTDNQSLGSYEDYCQDHYERRGAMRAKCSKRATSTVDTGGENEYARTLASDEAEVFEDDKAENTIGRSDTIHPPQSRPRPRKQRVNSPKPLSESNHHPPTPPP